MYFKASALVSPQTTSDTAPACVSAAWIRSGISSASKNLWVIEGH